MIFTKNWWKAMFIRAIKTACQSAAVMLPTSAFILSEVNWILLLSSAVGGFIASFITSLAGLPEVDETTGEEIAKG